MMNSFNKKFVFGKIDQKINKFQWQRTAIKKGSETVKSYTTKTTKKIKKGT